MESVIQQAVRESGGLTALAAKLGVKPPSLFKWRAANRVPAERVLAFEAATGIPRHQVRPDIYPPPAAGQAAA